MYFLLVYSPVALPPSNGAQLAEADLTGQCDLRLTMALLRSRRLNQVREFNWLSSGVVPGGTQVRKRSGAHSNNALPGTNMDASHGGCLLIFSVPGDNLLGITTL